MARREYIVGSGNVFEDLGHPRPAEALAKAELARKIAELIAKRRLTHAAAAELLNVDQPKVSALLRGHGEVRGSEATLEEGIRSPRECAAGVTRCFSIVLRDVLTVAE
jgi:predicted XRE-type DNA-binding protein